LNKDTQHASGITRRKFISTGLNSGVALASLGGLSGLLAACSSSQSGGASGGKGKTVSVGGLMSQTGAVSAVGKAVANGAQLRFDLINKNGGIKSLGGATIQLKVQDDQSNAQQAPSAVDQLTSSDVPLIIGGVSSTAMLNASTEADRSGVAMVNAVGVDSSITARGLTHLFTTCGSSTLYGSDFVQNTKAVLQANSYDPKNVVVLYETQVQGPLWVAALKKAFPEQTKWNVNYVGYDPTSNNFTPVVARLKQDNVDVVAMCSYPSDGTSLLQAMKSQNFTPKYLTGCMGGILSAEFEKSAGSLVDNFTGESYWVNDPKIPGVSDFQQAYSASNKGSTSIDVFTAMGYAAASVAADALERAGSTDRDKVTTALRQTNLSPGDAGFILPGGARFDDAGNNSAVKGVYYQFVGTTRQAIRPPEFATTQTKFPHGSWS